MTGMPELSPCCTPSSVMAAVLVGWNGYLHIQAGPDGAQSAVLNLKDLLGIHSAEVLIGICTFAGSIVAFLKLSGRIQSRPLILPGKNARNVGSLVAFAVLEAWFVVDPQLWLLVTVTVIALLLGRHLIALIWAGTCQWSSRC